MSRGNAISGAKVLGRETANQQRKRAVERAPEIIPLLLEAIQRHGTLHPRDLADEAGVNYAYAHLARQIAVLGGLIGRTNLRRGAQLFLTERGKIVLAIWTGSNAKKTSRWLRGLPAKRAARLALSTAAAAAEAANKAAEGA